MKIKIRDKIYEIERDLYCWTVYQWVEVKEGNNKGTFQKRHPTYHSMLAQVIRRLVDENIILPKESKDILLDLKTAISDAHEVIRKELGQGVVR